MGLRKWITWCVSTEHWVPVFLFFFCSARTGVVGKMNSMSKRNTVSSSRSNYNRCSCSSCSNNSYKRAETQMDASTHLKTQSHTRLNQADNRILPSMCTALIQFLQTIICKLLTFSLFEHAQLHTHLLPKNFHWFEFRCCKMENCIHANITRARTSHAPTACCAAELMLPLSRSRCVCVTDSVPFLCLIHQPLDPAHKIGTGFCSSPFAFGK